METIAPALSLLLRAWERAKELRADPWQFAVEITELRTLGLTTPDLRWLRLSGYVAHRIEITRSTDKRRRFGQGGRLQFSQRSCIVLTAAGARYARKKRVGPYYDREAREFWLGDVLIKRFRRPAPLQHLILSSFQELGWPRRIDDPLPKQIGLDRKLRLRDTIKRLNSNQRNRLIRFRGGGRGLGITWEVISHR